MLRGIDHVAIVVRDTERALRFWRDTMGLSVALTARAQAGTVQLTNLDLGNAHLQLVEPLTDDHPLLTWLGERESALHHLGLAVEDVSAYKEHAVATGLASEDAPIIPATLGRRAVFLDADAAQGVVIEIIAARESEAGR
jgi:methylmalonyl-CoA/ethylmalonyl-CoA epimerase